MARDIAPDGTPGPPRKLFSTRAPFQPGRNRFVATKDGQRFLAVTPLEARDPATTPFVVILNWQRLLEDQ